MSHSHNHLNCKPVWGVCNEGILTYFCDYEECSNEYCADMGHCECKCHSGKVCNCGYEWPREDRK